MTCQTCAALRDRLDEANEKIRRLEVELGSVMPFPALLGLTPSQERILAILLKRVYVSFECIDGVFASSNDTNIAKVHICHLREKLAPFDIGIETRWGRGYEMTAENKEKLRSLICKNPDKPSGNNTNE